MKYLKYLGLSLLLFSSFFGMGQTVTLTIDKITMAENGTATITATLNASHAGETIINFTPSGTAILDVDYLVTYTGKGAVTTVAGGNGQGSAANQFDYPYGVAVDASGNIYVADGTNQRIQKWAPGASEGTTVAGGNGYGSAANQLYSPYGVAVDASGNVFIADQDNHRIQKWAPGATTGTTVAGGNGQGSAANQLYYPYSVAVDASGNVFIADRSNHRIQKWAPGATTGTTVAGGNGLGSAANQLYSPYGVAVDASGNVFIADQNNHRIQKWAPGATTGTTVAGGNGQGSAANQLYYPYSVAVDASGNVFIADFFNHRIQKWAPGATTGTTVAGGNGQGSAANQLTYPYGVAVDALGNVFIADYYNHRIQKVTNAPQIIIPAGQTSATLTITGTDDAIDEPDETIILTPSATGADLASSAALNIAFTDNDLPPVIVVTGVSSTAGNGIYAIGNVISITVTFSANVTVTGTPQLTLETGSSDAVVNYSSGTGTNTLTFDYTVASGQITSKLDYVATSSLALNSGTINDAVGNAATLTLATPGAANSLGASKSIVVEGIVPTVTGVNSSTADGSYKQGDVVVITVEFSEAVYVTGTPQLTLESGSSDAVVDYRGGGSGSNTLTFNYTVASDHSTSDLDYVATSSLALNSGTINDAVGNAATLTLASPGAANSLGANKAIVVDTTDPTVSNVTSTAANGSYKVGNVIPITVEFSEVVNVTGTPQLRLETGSSDAVSEQADYSSGTGTNTLTFDYTVAWDHTTPDLDYVATTSLALSDPNPGYSWYKDTKGNATGVTISGNYAYVANSDAGLAIIDISDSASPGTPVYKDTKGNATGVAISGNYAYVSLNRIEASLFGSDDNFAGLAIIDISNPTNPGNPVYRDTNGRARGVAISSNYAYVANGSAGLAIIDISDPTNPGIPVYKDTEGYATGVTISGNYAYVADWTSGLAIIEISNPAVPGTPVYRDTDGYAQGVTINENYAYVADDYAGLAIIDISDPADPGTPVYRDTNGQYSSASCVAISGNYAYVASTNTRSGLTFIDISNPASPGTPGDYITKLGGATGVAISGNYAYLASGSGLAFVNTNVSDLTDAAGNRATLTLPSPGATGSLAGNKAIIVDNTPPTVINVTSTASDGSYKSGDVIPITLEFSEVVNITGTPQLALETGSSDAIVDYNSGTGTNTLTFNYTVASDHMTSDLDYLATNSLLLPAPNPGTPVYRDTNGEARGVAIRSNYAYLADKDAGLAIIDISDPTNPGTPMYKETNGNAYGVTISSNYAYVANGDAGLAIIDISDPTNPGIPVYKDTEGDATGVAISGNYAYVSTWSAGLAIIDISDPTNPGNPVYRDTDGSARKVALRGNYAYVANGDKPEGFSIIDISNPTIPGNPLFIDALGKGNDVAIKGNYAYVVDGGQWDVANSFTGLAIINISDPTNPGTPVYRDIDGTAYGVTISGKYAYVATQGSGLAIIDISDPTNPGTPVYKDTEGTAWSSTISGKYAYVADGGAGLAIIPTNTGLINNAEGNAATLTLASPGATNSLGANKAIVVDGTEPTMSINANQGIDGFTSEDSILSLTLTSSEAITDFIIGDITVIGGTMSAFVALNDSTYTAIFTASGEGAKTILVAVGTYKDLVGNENIAATQFNWIYDVDYSPLLLDATFTLAENSPNGTVVEIIEASDADGDTLSYTILSGNTDQAFGLNANTGVLSVTDSTALDYESTPVFSLLVRVSDGALSDSAIVT
ncbi:Ig-like domain-containing protein, partial [Cyclobacteriaceae bacterium]|nr:Ig-like domain-containing protein [Cyclobacteriaceae bacterium]